MIWLLMSCSGGDDPVLRDTADVGPREVPWSRGVPALDPGPRGYQARRSIVHLHSPWSHDACDGQGIDEVGPACRTSAAGCARRASTSRS